MQNKFPINDLDSIVWVFASGGIVALVALLMLLFNYCQFDAGKDLTTVSAIAATYFVAALSKRIIRVKQREKRETEKE